jgi:2,5-diketo-D-gluconate reductase A
MTVSAAHRPGRQVQSLADGNEVPVLGLGVWQVPDGPVCVNAVRAALESGYRHIDTAQAYGNEQSVGRAVRESGIGREEVFVTTKFYPARPNPAAELEGSLRRLGVDYVDLYIVHWPQRGPTWAWRGMERAREAGHARSIGVSNFDARQLQEVMATASSAPVVDQVQFSPFEYRRALLDAARERTGRHLSHPAVRAIASATGRTPAQVLLRWCLQRGLVVVTKSTHRDRIEENAQIFDFTLSTEQMAALDHLDRTGGTDRALERPWW